MCFNFRRISSVASFCTQGSDGVPKLLSLNLAVKFQRFCVQVLSFLCFTAHKTKSFNSKVSPGLFHSSSPLADGLVHICLGILARALGNNFVFGSVFHQVVLAETAHGLLPLASENCGPGTRPLGQCFLGARRLSLHLSGDARWPLSNHTALWMALDYRLLQLLGIVAICKCLRRCFSWCSPASFPIEWREPCPPLLAAYQCAHWQSLDHRLLQLLRIVAAGN